MYFSGGLLPRESELINLFCCWFHKSKEDTSSSVRQWGQYIMCLMTDISSLRPERHTFNGWPKVKQFQTLGMAWGLAFAESQLHLGRYSSLCPFILIIFNPPLQICSELLLFLGLYSLPKVAEHNELLQWPLCVCDISRMLVVNLCFSPPHL